MSGTGAAEDAYARANRDEVFLARVRAAYTGSHDVLDALCWLSRPLDAGPSGAPSPLVLVQELQRRVYSADADPAKIGDAHERLREALRAVEDDRFAIEQAVNAPTAEIEEARRAEVAVSRHQDPTRAMAPSTEAGGSRHPDTGQASGATGRDENFQPSLEPEPKREPEPEPEHLPANVTRRRSLLVAIGAVAALLVGVVVGAQWPVWSQTLAGTAEGAAPDAPSELPREVQAYFDRTDEVYLTPPGILPDFLNPDSVRLATMADVTPVLVARTTSGLACLVAVPHRAAHTASCVAPAEFPASGLSISWEARGIGPEQDEQLLSWTAILQPDGTTMTTFEIVG